MSLDRRHFLKTGAAIGAGLLIPSTPTDKTAEELQDDVDEAEGMKMYDSSEHEYLRELYFKDERLPKLWEEYKLRFAALQRTIHSGPNGETQVRDALNAEFSEKARPIMAELDRKYIREHMRVNAKFLLKHDKETTWILQIENASCRRCEDGSFDIKWISKYPIRGYTLVLAYIYATRKDRDIALKELASGKPDEAAISKISTKLNFRSNWSRSVFSDTTSETPDSWISSEVSVPESTTSKHWSNRLFGPEINIRREKIPPKPEIKDQKKTGNKR